MAKSKKTPRILIALCCSVCGAQNYLTEKNKTNTVIGAKKIPNTKKVPNSNNKKFGKHLHFSA